MIETFTVGLKMARIPSNNTIVNYSISTSFIFSNLVVFQKLPLLCLSSGNIFFCLFLITMLVALCQHFLFGNDRTRASVPSGRRRALGPAAQLN